MKLGEIHIKLIIFSTFSFKNISVSGKLNYFALRKFRLKASGNLAIFFLLLMFDDAIHRVDPVQGPIFRVWQVGSSEKRKIQVCYQSHTVEPHKDYFENCITLTLAIKTGFKTVNLLLLNKYHTSESRSSIRGIFLSNVNSYKKVQSNEK